MQYNTIQYNTIQYNIGIYKVLFLKDTKCKIQYKKSNKNNNKYRPIDKK